MAARTDVAAAANARLRPVVEYGVDPRGHGLFAALTGAARATMTNARAVVDRGADFDGWAAPPQVFRGLAPLALGGALPYTDANSQLADERSAVIDDPSLRLFAERLKRRDPMNPQALRAFFEKNKKTFAVAGAVGVGGLGLMAARGKKTAAAAGPNQAPPSSALSAGGRPVSTSPGYTTGAASYDSSVNDLYGALAPMLERLQGQQSSPIPVTKPPIASTLFDATGSGTYVWADGAVNEVQADGSLLHLTQGMWDRVNALTGHEAERNATFLDRDSGVLQKFYTVEGNLAGAAAQSTPSQWQMVRGKAQQVPTS